MRKLRPLILIVALVTAGACGKKKEEPGTPPVAGKGGDGKGGGNGDGKGGGSGKGEGKGGGKGDGKGGAPASSIVAARSRPTSAGPGPTKNRSGASRPITSVGEPSLSTR